MPPMPDARDPAPDDTALAAVPVLVKLAAGVVFLAGAIGAIHVLQLFGLIGRIRGPFAFAPHAMGLESAGAIVAGVALARARGWAWWVASTSGGLLWTTSAAWFLFALGNGFFTLFGFLVPCLGFGALVFGLLARKACQVTAEARRRLAEQGFELGT